MKIDNLKELDALIKLCRKRGIETVKVDGIEFKLSDSYQEQKPVHTTNGYNPAPDVIDSDELTEEQLMMWSVEGNPTEGN